jgi:transcriptional regulator NrdR family protein
MAAAKAADEIVDEIERELAAAEEAVGTRQIGEMALARLRRRDLAAYIRYASVHLEFETAADFVKAVRALDAASPPPRVAKEEKKKK